MSRLFRFFEAVHTLWTHSASMLTLSALAHIFTIGLLSLCRIYSALVIQQNRRYSVVAVSTISQAQQYNQSASTTNNTLLVTTLQQRTMESATDSCLAHDLFHHLLLLHYRVVNTSLDHNCGTRVFDHTNTCTTCLQQQTNTLAKLAC